MELAAMPRIIGKPRVPILSLHNIGDLFVPLCMEQVCVGDVLARNPLASHLSQGGR
ncbi:hypothetical protein [Streptomyces coelicoflavus]|uniref:hypothetical protein n=1 Tax=Streptomyces coelicoflavus TaxID=285562 RepID=UPI0033171633